MKANKKFSSPHPLSKIARQWGNRKEYDLIEVIKKLVTLETFLKILNAIFIQFFFVRFTIFIQREYFHENGVCCHYDDFLITKGNIKKTKCIGIMYFVFPFTGYITPYISIGRIKYLQISNPEYID